MNDHGVSIGYVVLTLLSHDSHVVRMGCGLVTLYHVLNLGLIAKANQDFGGWKAAAIVPPPLTPMHAATSLLRPDHTVAV